MTGQSALPFVHFADSILYANRAESFHTAYVARLFMPLKDGGTVTVGGKCHPLKRFDLIYIPPATPYRFHCAEISPLIAVNFDFSERFSSQKTFRPVFQTDFDPALVHGDVPNAFAAPMRFPRAEPLHALLISLIKEHLSPDAYGRRMANLLLAQILLWVERMGETPLSSKEENISSKAIAFLNEHAAESDCEEKLAVFLAYHPYYINRIFKKHTGETVHSYLLRVRVRLAAAMLRENEKKNEEIAALVGLPNPTHFAKIFRRYMGMTPTSYRKAPPPL